MELKESRRVLEVGDEDGFEETQGVGVDLEEFGVDLSLGLSQDDVLEHHIQFGTDVAEGEDLVGVEGGASSCVKA